MCRRASRGLPADREFRATPWATVNMDGTALYECVAVLFVVQLFGFDLTLSEQFFVVLTALLTNWVAGVPSASLVAIVIIITVLESQLIGRGVIDGETGNGCTFGLLLILVFDRFLDMGRTVVNVGSMWCRRDRQSHGR